MPTTDTKVARTGGPAFPRPASEFTSGGTLADGNDAIAEQDGMTLRDYFAGQALAAMPLQISIETPAAEFMATSAYKVADAMLRERAK